MRRFAQVFVGGAFIYSVIAAWIKSLEIPPNAQSIVGFVVGANVMLLCFLLSRHYANLNIS
jgi:predicted esterase